MLRACCALLRRSCAMPVMTMHCGPCHRAGVLPYLHCTGAQPTAVCSANLRVTCQLPYAGAVQCRSRVMLMLSYLLSIGAVAAAVTLLLMEKSKAGHTEPDAPPADTWMGASSLISVRVRYACTCQMLWASKHPIVSIGSYACFPNRPPLLAPKSAYPAISSSLLAHRLALAVLLPPVVFVWICCRIILFLCWPLTIAPGRSYSGLTSNPSQSPSVLSSTGVPHLCIWANHMGVPYWQRELLLVLVHLSSKLAWSWCTRSCCVLVFPRMGKKRGPADLGIGPPALVIYVCMPC